MPYTFPGFDALAYTPIPDIFLDELMCHLTEAELRVALYILRRTFGFKKHSDDISLSQMVNGITTRDGKVLDHGCGVQRAAVIRAVRGLEEKGVVIARRNSSTSRGNEATTYTLRFRGEDPKETRGGIFSEPPPVAVGIEAPGSLGSTQETDIQEDSSQERDHSTLDAKIDGLSVHFGDTATGKANRTRARNLSAQYGLLPKVTAQCVAEAARRTTKATPAKPMAYFFETLEDLLRQHPAALPNLAGRYRHVVRR